MCAIRRICNGDRDDDDNGFGSLFWEIDFGWPFRSDSKVTLPWENVNFFRLTSPSTSASFFSAMVQVKNKVCLM